jgi:hypothetical protein
MCKILIEGGADPNSVYQNKTALHKAVSVDSLVSSKIKMIMYLSSVCDIQKETNLGNFMVYSENLYKRGIYQNVHEELIKIELFRNLLIKK